MMIDENVAFASPATVYRLLKDAGLLNRWHDSKAAKKDGFDQPESVHEHWHMDISYVKVLSEPHFLIAVLDGASRAILAHDLRKNMQTADVEIVLEQARERFPMARPRMITDNGSQFVAKEFRCFVKACEFDHVRTRVNHPQSNGKIERLFKTVKNELIRRQAFISLEDACSRINAFVEYYNTVRLHSAICYLTPDDALNNRIEQRLKERKQKLENAKIQRRKAVENSL